MPEPLVREVVISTFVDANHVRNKITQISHTGITIFVYNALNQFFWKRQNNVASSTFGSDPVALWISRDFVFALRIILKYFGVPIRGPENLFSNNEPLYKNVRKPGSTLNKNKNAINYHMFRESVAAGIMRMGKEDTHMNPADVFTKLMPYSNK